MTRVAGGDNLLADWWRDQAAGEIKGTVEKAAIYGAYDLELVGRMLADIVGWPGDTDTATLTELGISFYIAGKLGRMIGAIREGRLASDDSIADLAIYTRMIQRTRQCGSWPGPVRKPVKIAGQQTIDDAISG